MPDVRVILVEPKNEGNVGAVARAMKNFGIQDLVLVNPCPLSDEAMKRAMHGASVLAGARTVKDFDAAIAGAGLVVGTTGIDTASEKRFVRIAVTPRELTERLAAMDGVVALAFGREDFGLLDEELRRCDLLATIPASEDYPILNLSHAATILLYELFLVKARARGRRRASALEKEKLHEAFEALMGVTEYPVHKRERTKIMFRRLMGRAVPSKWEFHALMGVFQRATKRIHRLEEKRKAPR